MGQPRRPTRLTIAKRNACVAALANRLLIAHAAPGGKIERLCKDAAAQGKPVFILGSSDNAHLLRPGIVPIRPDNPEPLAGAFVQKR